jgi:hypothetical protein
MAATLPETKTFKNPKSSNGIFVPRNYDYSYYYNYNFGCNHSQLQLLLQLQIQIHLNDVDWRLWICSLSWLSRNHLSSMPGCPQFRPRYFDLDKVLYSAVLRIRIRRINMFLGLPDPDPLVRDMDPDPSNIKQN